MSLLVLCPSRGRPDKAAALQAVFDATKTLDTTRLVFILDEDDAAPYSVGYQQRITPSGRRGMTDPLNAAAAFAWDYWDAIGFVGDDHRFRTRGWDAYFEDQFAQGPRLVYGNDLNWPNGEIPTQIFGSSEIWKALGWMALPAAQHLYLDNVWRVIGDALGCLYYFPQIVIEHVHPAYGKTEWDEGYRAVNSQEMYDHDRVEFESWLMSGQSGIDIERVRRALDGGSTAGTTPGDGDMGVGDSRSEPEAV